MASQALMKIGFLPDKQIYSGSGFICADIAIIVRVIANAVALDIADWFNLVDYQEALGRFFAPDIGAIFGYHLVVAARLLLVPFPHMGSSQPPVHKRQVWHSQAAKVNSVPV